MKTNKKVRAKLEAMGMSHWTPEAAATICCVCGKPFDTGGPPPLCIVKPGTKDARRYYPLGLYTHQTHAPGSQEWYLSLDPRDSRDTELTKYYETTYGPHPGKPKYGMSNFLIIERLTLPVDQAPAVLPKAPKTVTSLDDEPPSTRPRPSRVAPEKAVVSRSVAPVAAPVRVPKAQRPVHPISAALNGLDEKKLTAIAKANGLDKEWMGWVKKFVGNFPMAKMQLNGALRRLHDKGIKVKGL